MTCLESTLALPLVRVAFSFDDIPSTFELLDSELLSTYAVSASFLSCHVFKASSGVSSDNGYHGAKGACWDARRKNATGATKH